MVEDNVLTQYLADANVDPNIEKDIRGGDYTIASVIYIIH